LDTEYSVESSNPVENQGSRRNKQLPRLKKILHPLPFKTPGEMHRTKHRPTLVFNILLSN